MLKEAIEETKETLKRKGPVDTISVIILRNQLAIMEALLILLEDQSKETHTFFSDI